MAVVVRLRGGLGNQMFQFATGYALSKNLGVDLKLDISLVIKDLLREFELERVFKIKTQIISTSELSKIEQKHRLFKNIIGDKMYNKLVPYYKRPIIYERNFAYDANFPRYNNNSVIEGYRQSYKYFNPYKSEISSLFSFKEEKMDLSVDNSKYINLISEAERSVSIHIRRSDYLTSNLHHLLPVEYYADAIIQIKRMFGNSIRFFVFSDDHQWVQDNLLLPIETTYIQGNNGSNSYLDMYLMSKCKINVIANSSFSWWAAWLNQNPEKFVIAPKKWFNDPALITDDLIPSNWLRL